MVGGRHSTPLLPLTRCHHHHPSSRPMVMMVVVVVGRCSSVALVLHHPLHPEVVLDVLLHVDIAEALADVGPVLASCWPTGGRRLLLVLLVGMMGMGRCRLHVRRRRFLLGQRPFQYGARGGGSGAGRRRIGSGQSAAAASATAGEKGACGPIGQMVRRHERLLGQGSAGLLLLLAVWIGRGKSAVMLLLVVVMVVGGERQAALLELLRGGGGGGEEGRVGRIARLPATL